MTAKAEALDDGSFSVSGTKIFITGGEQDLTENIIHLVLAKIPGAPEGPRGMSMFVVPKFLLNDDGSLGARNTVTCGSIEHKMGIKGSATCVMNFDSAKGFLVGEENKGLNYMFTMMNYERLGMGIQGVGAAETSYQQAAEYAIERIQGRSATGAKSADKKADSLIVHPDVRKMLLTMRAFNEGGRCFSTYVAKQLDIVKFSADEAEKQQAEQLVALLTPVAKAFMTDMAYESCNLGQMVFGGHGYVREWGQEQLVRDVRIAQIYEGTNGIQALDLLGRKVVANKGQFLETYFTEIRAFIEKNTKQQVLAGFIKPLAGALEKLEAVTDLIITVQKTDKDMVGASATDYLAAFGLLSYAYMWAIMAEKASKQITNDFYQAKLYVGDFFVQRILPRIDSHINAIEAGSASLMVMPEGLFNYNH
jgi:alkylation response protein AidB-like acyl-CoA dehydrogenase